MTDSESKNDENKRIDEDWKVRAEEEKRKIEAAMGPPPGAQTPTGAGTASAGDRVAGDGVAGDEGGGEGTGSNPSFLNLVSQLGAQAMAALGQLEDPNTGQRYVDLELARESINILSMLEQKTHGNLDAEEKATLDELLGSLRMVFVQISRAAQKQAMNAPSPGSPGAPGNPA